MTRGAAPEQPVHRPTVKVKILRHEGPRRETAIDVAVREEPLELRVADEAGEHPLGLIMRTPGHDEELALGLLFAEGVVGSARDIRAFSWEPPSGEAQEYNSLRVQLAPGLGVDWTRLARPLLATSACGVCGSALLAALPASHRAPEGFRMDRECLLGVPEALRQKQALFEKTGGLHAAASVAPGGSVLHVREDVGRHNAVDKLVGALLKEDPGLLPRSALFVSGRAGFEILAKAARASIPFVAAVGAPSSLAIDVAQRHSLTLVGFLRGDRFNVYSGGERITG